MADANETEFNRSGLTVKCNRVWYTGQRAEKIPAGLIGIVGSKCTSLDLSYNELASISAVRDFVNLEELILDNNKLRNCNTLPHMPNLLTLSLNNNKFKDIDSLLQRIKTCCPKIQYVSLLGNPGCPDQLTDPDNYDEDDYNRYRLYAIYVLPKTLTFLDSRMVTQKERRDAEHRGCFLKTVRLALKTTPEMVSQNAIDEIDEIIFNLRYTPLPKTQRNPQDHRAGAFGKCRYRYSGKNSEGNRFILNNDL